MAKKPQPTGKKVLVAQLKREPGAKEPIGQYRAAFYYVDEAHLELVEQSEPDLQFCALSIIEEKLTQHVAPK